MEFKKQKARIKLTLKENYGKATIINIVVSGGKDYEKACGAKCSTEFIVGTRNCHIGSL